MRFVFLSLCLVHATWAAGLANVAFKKPAAMSSKLNAAAGVASRVTDGNVSKKIGTCIQTQVALDSWVRVDLQGRYRVHFTTISTPIGKPQSNYMILVSEQPVTNVHNPPKNQICRVHDGVVPGFARLADLCNYNSAPLMGRYVTMVTKGVTSLKICELQVLAEPADTDRPVFNVALNKPVRQSKPYSANARPQKINDGNFRGFDVSQCTIVEPEGNKAPWIQIDLGAQYPISVVLVRDAGHKYGQRKDNNLIALVSDNRELVTVNGKQTNRCNQYTSLRVDTIAMMCLRNGVPMLGRYVTLTQGKSKPLYVCEVRLYVPGNAVTTPAPTTQPPTTQPPTTTTTITTTTTTTTTTALPDVCSPNPCKNGGTCSLQITRDRLSLFKCTCAKGYSGETCDQAVDTSGACSSRPCQNGGSCKPTAYGSFKCTCPALYQGDTCEIKSAWVNSPCGDVETGCTGVNTVCFKGKCLCTPGYYYSLSSQTCIKSCPKSSLQSSFMIYPGSRIKKNKDAKELNLNPDECKAICSKDKNCLCISMLDNEVKPKCFLHTVDVLDVPDDWTDTREDWDYYQRHCV